MKHKIFSSYSHKGFLWFRIFGYGLVVKNARTHNLLFSERSNLCANIRAGKWFIRPLLP